MTLRPYYAEAEAALTRGRNTRSARLNEEVIVDKNADPVYLDEVDQAFRPLGTYPCGTRNPTQFLGPKPRFVASDRDELLQLVDMLCGATCDHLLGENNWFRLIESRCLDVMDVSVK
jgi:hypothetical protein